MKKAIIGILVLSLWTGLILTGCSSEEEVAIAIPADEPEEPAMSKIPEVDNPPTEPVEEEAEKPDAGETGSDQTDTGEGADSDMTYDNIKASVEDFNLKLYKECEGKGNLFYSPYSIVSALALTDLAAVGETKEEMEKVLNITDFESFKQEIKAFNGKKQSEKAYLKTANGLFIDKSLELSDNYKADFEDPAKEFFKGEFRSVDFKDTETVRKEITDWVNDATEEMIPDYSSAAGADTVADILNAVYFYGEWQKKFSANDTWKDPFRTADGDKEVDMMHMDHESFRYISDVDGVKAVALPYDDGSYEMDIFMYADPEKKETEGIFDIISGKDMLSQLDNAEKTELSKLALPKFKMDLELDGLKEKLIAAGMQTAFSEGADFSLLAKNLKISDICHRAVVEVDEEGSRAAAVTELVMELTSMMPMEEKTEDFIADKPFVFMIRDSKSGVILFTGRVNEL
ncbi:MAG: serpin family protein [Lachnospiraceae bacterium]|nr:serpin family protein [Lachnospiraceae bacterium]